tara:strand:+ start:148 stop:702 length:555 start_codon:yes stop_codon:yes gene_type:complete
MRNEMDAVEVLTTKLFDIKDQIKENDYLILMNACKDIANARNPKITHRLYFTITTHYMNNEEPDSYRTSFYLRVRLNDTLEYLALGSEEPVKLKHLLKEKECQLDNIFQLTEIEYYYSKHIKDLGEMIRCNEVLSDIKIGETTLEQMFVRPERQEEIDIRNQVLEQVNIFFPPPHPTHDIEYEP